jgi:hypothetical protein
MKRGFWGWNRDDKGTKLYICGIALENLWLWLIVELKIQNLVLLGKKGYNMGVINYGEENIQERKLIVVIPYTWKCIMVDKSSPEGLP